MLIYVNQFNFIGNDSSREAFNIIAGWLKIVTKKHFSIEDLVNGREFSINRSKVRTYSAVEFDPKMYSILLSHPDSIVKGRQWITEIGIKIEDETTTVSILLETSDISTLVKEIPSTTRPKLVSFLLKSELLENTTIGLQPRTLRNDELDFKALSYEIERKTRTYPIVLVSNCKLDKKALVNPFKLQEQLLGLAQVVYTENEVNSWELENVLTRQYSAWDGSINIIYQLANGYKSRLLLKEKINDLINSGINISQEILSYITHTTNGCHKKLHFSPTDIRAKRQKDQRIRLKKRFDELSNDSEYQLLAEEAFLQLEEQDAVIDQLKSEYQHQIDDQILKSIEIQERLDQANEDYYTLKLRFDELQENTSRSGSPIITYGSETEKYKGEIIDATLDGLKLLLNSTIQNSRKNQILKDILINNCADGTRERFLQELKGIFTNYNGVTPKIKAELKKMGLEIIEDGNHNYVRFLNDERYKVTFAKTPSDKRVGNNIIRDIKATLL